VTTAELSHLGPDASDFAALADNLPEAAWIANADGWIYWYNRQWFSYTGTTPSEMVGWGWQTVHHPDTLPDVLERWKLSIATGEPFEMVFPLRGADGVFRPFLTRVRPWRDDKGKIRRWFGSNTEITIQERVAAELSEQKHVLETLNRTAAVIAAEFDQHKLVQAVTDAAVNLTKAQFGAFFYNVTNEKGESYTLYTISGVPRDKFSKFPMPRNTEVFDPTFRGVAIIRSGDITKDPRYGRSAPYHGMPEGHLPVRSYLAVPVISHSGEVMGGLFFGHARADVFTEYHEQILEGLAAQAAVGVDSARLYENAQREIAIRAGTEIALREREADLRLLLDSSADGFYAVDREGVTTQCNLAFLRMLGFTSERDAIGRKLHDVIHHTRPDGTHFPKDECQIYRTAQNGEPGHVVGELFFRLDGTSFPVEYSTRPIVRNGELQGAVCNFRDISERAKAEESRQLLLRELNHRVKNLFAIISGMITMTAKSATSPQAMAETLRGRLHALARAHELIRSAITSDNDNTGVTTVQELVSSVMAPHLTPGKDQLRITGEVVRLGVSSATSLAFVLHELATNAAKYGALSVPDGRVQIEWRVESEYLKLTWLESGGPLVESPPQKTGFGTQLAHMSAGGQLGGSITFDWMRSGVGITLLAKQERLEN
jgi:PAS domain S-box-containing protein